ncbi:endonuclease MutS2 [Weissella coleopterorum]|uniref:Endonuclease MutS2 n=1 Tax=Weissella coleopterorum TaxID=2714949 RepID=A0A6G8B129_9LACO|nr:endonuclease MutS2 [Weissella coleopterorum]QIL50940.1 endonuclease MutS2 [Weissella coleopterorum]
MNHKILETLEYDVIKQQLHNKIMTAGGELELETLTPTSDANEMQKWLAETADAMTIIRIAGGMQLSRLGNIKPQMKRLKIDADLNGTELAQVGRVLFATGQVKQFFDNFILDHDEELEHLSPYVDRLMTLPELTKQLNQAIDQDGRITDEASSELKRIRQLILGTENGIRQKMQEYTRGKMAKYLSDPIVTIRNDRYVVPVRAENRNKFGGVVHDQSQTGQTLYIEPAPVVDLNNRLKEAQLKERAEEVRVLHDLSMALQPYQDEILENAQLLGHLDFVNAKALYAVDLKAVQPEYSSEKNIRLIQARHPLLDQRRAVANDIILGEDYSAIIVTGPNTGGKTITLKTLGLLQIMAQSGLFIPADEYSTVGIFDNIFADIGDEQSIEQSLSTFSSHMVNIVDILYQITANSLVLFDELGAGTDPQEGAALAMAILDAVGAVGAYTVATTHYPELKVYGYNRVDTINASMEFDVETLKPTYRFMIGIPGRSNALEISKRLGLSNAIIEQASQLTSDDSQELNDMIQDLVDKRNLVTKQQIELEQQLQINRVKTNQLDQATTKFEVEQAQMLNQAQSEANHIVAESRKQADKIIAELHRLQRQGANVKENQIIDAKGALNALKQEPTAENNRILRRAKTKKQVAIAVGDTVLVPEYGQQGTILRQLKDGKYEVQIGILKMVLPGTEIEKQSGVMATQTNKTKQVKNNVNAKSKRNVSLNQATNRANASATLDLRGVRYEAAMHELDRFIDSALLNNLSSVEIIHGKGTGAIRKGTHEYLRSHRAVKQFNFTGPDQGATYAELN